MKLRDVPNRTVVRLNDLQCYVSNLIYSSPYSHKELAAMANVSQSSIGRYTRGEIDSPSLEWIVRVFKALDISIDILLDFID